MTLFIIDRPDEQYTAYFYGTIAALVFDDGGVQTYRPEDGDDEDDRETALRAYWESGL
jgi:hypothetical protein